MTRLVASAGTVSMEKNASLSALHVHPPLFDFSVRNDGNLKETFDDVVNRIHHPNYRPCLTVGGEAASEEPSLLEEDLLEEDSVSKCDVNKLTIEELKEKLDETNPDTEMLMHIYDLLLKRRPKKNTEVTADIMKKAEDVLATAKL